MAGGQGTCKPRESAVFADVQQGEGVGGYTSVPNPCLGVKGFKETGRTRYVTDSEFDLVRAQAHYTVVDAMDLALLTGQRPADVLKFKRSDIRDDALWIVQNKTGARLGIEVIGELAAVIDRITQRDTKAISDYLMQNENGQPVTQCALRSRFDKARTLAKVAFQFRDIRAKAATDTGDLAHSQKLLAHKNRDMTEHYVRARIGERVQPLR
jgi:integrase